MMVPAWHMYMSVVCRLGTNPKPSTDNKRSAFRGNNGPVSLRVSKGRHGG